MEIDRTAGIHYMEHGRIAVLVAAVPGSQHERRVENPDVPALLLTRCG
jgi:hypothetical protein